jgi:lincosamide nucleotidyltransferase A/C/D/E
MSASVLVELLRLLEAAGIDVWLDGGWGVDALIGTQSRTHKDVDIVVRVDDVPGLKVILGTQGFTIRRGSPPDSFALGDELRLEVDVHAVVFDSMGNGLYRMENGEIWIYPAEGFSGSGVIDGRVVRCLSPAVQVLCHAHGYLPTEKDIRDMRLLEERFGVELPPHLRRGAFGA